MDGLPKFNVFCEFSSGCDWDYVLYPFIVIKGFVNFNFSFLHLANNMGAMFLAAFPLIQLEVQKEANLPSPTVTTVEALNSS
jgi:hypothetical protein